MKSFPIAIALIALTISDTQAAQRASVHGRISRLVETVPGESRIKTVPITTHRLFKEYGLSRRDYFLGYDNGSYVPLEFYARRPGLPNIRVFEVSLDSVTRRVLQNPNGTRPERTLYELPLFASEVIQPGKSPNFLTGFRGTGLEDAVFGKDSMAEVHTRVIGSSDTYFFNFTIRAVGPEVPHGIDIQP